MEHSKFEVCIIGRYQIRETHSGTICERHLGFNASETVGKIDDVNSNFVCVTGHYFTSSIMLYAKQLGIILQLNTVPFVDNSNIYKIL